MKKELDELLCSKYPRIFRDRHANMRTTAMCWGFEIGDGWFNIINHACNRIQSHIDHSRKTRARALVYNRALTRALRGDLRNLERFHSFRGKFTEYGRQNVERDLANPKFMNVPDAVTQVVAVQIKEKWGSLRFYTYGGDSYTHGIIDLAESLSEVTCEECGSPGKIYTDGWHVALCSQHAEEQKRTDNVNLEDTDY